MIDETKLPAPWRTVREVTTAGTLPPYENPVLLQKYRGRLLSEWVFAEFIGGMETDVAHYRPLKSDGSTGPLVERTPTVTREWTEKPPNDRAYIAIVFDDGSCDVYRGEANQCPGHAMRAWAPMREVIAAAMSIPRTVHVAVTAEDIYDIAGTNRPADCAKILNARLAARAAAPVVTGEQLFRVRYPNGVWYTQNVSFHVEWNAAANRLTAALASGVAP